MEIPHQTGSAGKGILTWLSNAQGYQKSKSPGNAASNGYRKCQNGS